MSDYELVLVHHTALRQIMSDACYGHASGGTNRGSTVQEMENLGNKSSGRFLTLLKISHDFLSLPYPLSMSTDLKVLCSDPRTHILNGQV